MADSIWDWPLWDENLWDDIGEAVTAGALGQVLISLSIDTLPICKFQLVRTI